jgi:hypothetical protein
VNILYESRSLPAVKVFAHKLIHRNCAKDAALPAAAPAPEHAVFLDVAFLLIEINGLLCPWAHCSQTYPQNVFRTQGSNIYRLWISSLARRTFSLPIFYARKNSSLKSRHLSSPRLLAHILIHSLCWQVGDKLAARDGARVRVFKNWRRFCPFLPLPCFCARQK